MKLPKGVTGFGPVVDLPKIIIDGKVFKRLCHALAQQLGARLISCNTDLGLASNYYNAVFEFRQKRIMVLCNPFCAYIAFANEHFYHDEFLDEPNFAQAFMVFENFHVLTRDLLETFPKAEYLSELHKGELAQIKHWNPKRLGDIIFNFWD